MFPPIKSTVEPTAGTWKAEYGSVWSYFPSPTLDAAPGAFIDTPEPVLIASVYGKGVLRSVEEPEVVANTNIMAAAKDLLAVAVEIEANTALSDALRKKARAAIRKAKGLTNGQEAHRPRRRRKLAYL